MCSAYEALDDSIKSLIKGKKVFYKNAYVNQPPVEHPLVRINLITSRKALFVNIHRALGINDIEYSQAIELINFLYKHATKPEFVYKHKWSNGDLLVWHNPTTMHCATHIEDTEERLLYRILTEGVYPVI